MPCLNTILTGTTIPSRSDTPKPNRCTASNLHASFGVSSVAAKAAEVADKEEAKAASVAGSAEVEEVSVAIAAGRLVVEVGSNHDASTTFKRRCLSDHSVDDPRHDWLRIVGA